MHAEISYVLAFSIGLLGGVHCLGMCGGIVAVLSMNDEPGNGFSLASVLKLLAYNAGRIMSYAVAGMSVGYLGASAVDFSGMQGLRTGFQVVSGVFMLLLGFYLAGWWNALTVVERTGALLWRRIEPLGRQFIPVTSPLAALMVGLVWGWLPCGLVYSVLVWSFASADTWQGGGLMIAFGLGTLPNLLAMGLFAESLAQFVRNPVVRQLAGIIVMLFGIYQIILALSPWH